jgi:hypothetical protein
MQTDSLLVTIGALIVFVAFMGLLAWAERRTRPRS